MAIFLNLSASIRYYKKKKIDLSLCKIFIFISIIGSIIGSYIVISLNQAFVKEIISFVLIILLIIVLIKNKAGLEEYKQSKKKFNMIFAGFIIFILGVYGGFIGIVVTTFLTFAFVLIMKKSFIEAIGNSLLITAGISLFSTLIFVLNNHVIFSLGLPMGVGAILGSVIGSSLAIKKGSKWIRYLFIIVVIIFIIKLLFNL